MTHLRVKICGLTRIDDAQAAADAGAWAIGLIFALSSPRKVAIRQARLIAAAVPPTVRRVGVFADQPLDDILQAIDEVPLDLIQLHGSEPEDLCRRIGPARCIRAITLDGPIDPQDAIQSEAAYLLVDRPKQQKTPLDLELAGRIAKMREQTILAGGLSPANVADAICRVQPWGVDVTSGIEVSPGVKDHAKMKAFFEELRAIQ